MEHEKVLKVFGLEEYVFLGLKFRSNSWREKRQNEDMKILERDPCLQRQNLARPLDAARVTRAGTLFVLFFLASIWEGKRSLSHNFF